MDAQIREVTALEEAGRLAPRLDACAAEAAREFRDDPFPKGSCAGFLARSFGAPETLLLVAERADGAADLGLCLVGPFVDPLTDERLPMVLVLYVEPSVRHRGLARELVREAGEQLAARGRTTLSARAPYNDDALISMGERWGFVRSWELLLRE